MDVTLPSAANIALLLAAGLTAGSVNAVAGGGSLITFPALLATGLPPITANTSNSVSLAPGYLASVAGSRPDLAGQGRRVRNLVPAAVLGSVAGSLLLLATPPGVFDVVVPFLVLSASAALGLQSRIQRVVGHPRGRTARQRAVSMQVLTVLGAVYGGYFGGALGVVLLAVLALVLDERLQRIGALKNALSAVIGVVSAATFALVGPVSWGSVLVLSPAAVAGGFFGAVVTRRMPAGVLRAVVVGLGLVVGAILAVRAFLGD